MLLPFVHQEQCANPGKSNLDDDTNQLSEEQEPEPCSQQEEKKALAQ
jgi:hypothetical protein